MTNEEKINSDKELLDGITSQISSFDNKAGILISVVGIIFAFSFSVFEVFAVVTNHLLLIWLSIIYSVFVLSTFVTVFLAVMVIVPRVNKMEKVNVNYYRDVIEMKYGSFSINRDAFFTKDEILFNQIKMNAVICNKKHKFLFGSIISLIPLAFLSLTLISIIILCFVL